MEAMEGFAMRVSAAGWLYPDLEQTRAVARATAKVTHNHPEGIKGAEATASCIFLALKWKVKGRDPGICNRRISL